MTWRRWAIMLLFLLVVGGVMLGVMVENHEVKQKALERLTKAAVPLGLSEKQQISNGVPQCGATTNSTSKALYHGPETCAVFAVYRTNGNPGNSLEAQHLSKDRSGNYKKRFDTYIVCAQLLSDERLRLFSGPPCE